MYTVENSYNAIQYNVMFYTALQLLRQNINRNFVCATDAPHLALMGELYDAWCEEFGKTHNGTARYTLINKEMCHYKLPIILRFFGVFII